MYRCKVITYSKGKHQPGKVANPLGNPFKCHEDVLSLQPMTPTKRFDMFSPPCGMLRRSRCVQIFFLNNESRLFLSRI